MLIPVKLTLSLLYVILFTDWYFYNLGGNAHRKGKPMKTNVISKATITVTRKQMTDHIEWIVQLDDGSDTPNQKWCRHPEEITDTIFNILADERVI